MTTKCSLIRPDSQTLFNRHLSLISANVLGGAPIIPQSNEWYVAALNHQLSEQFWSISELMWRERDPRQACCDNLVAMAAVDGVYPAPATFPEGYVTLIGTPGARLVPTLQVQFAQDYYKPASPATVPLVLPPSGSVTLRVRSTRAGAVNAAPAPGERGRLVTPLEGVNPVVTVHGNPFCNGRDAESCDAFRDRYIARQQFRPNMTWRLFEETLLSWPCVTRVCPRGPNCCPADPGPECGAKPVQAFVLFDNTFADGIAPTNILEEITVWMFGSTQGMGLGRMPIGICGEILPVTACPITVTYSGLGCATPAQKEEVQRRTALLFRNICPETTICKAQFIALVAQIIPNICDFDVTLNGSCAVNECGDLEAGCQQMPTLATIEIF